MCFCLVFFLLSTCITLNMEAAAQFLANKCARRATLRVTGPQALAF